MVFVFISWYSLCSSPVGPSKSTWTNWRGTFCVQPGKSLHKNTNRGWRVRWKVFCFVFVFYFFFSSEIQCGNQSTWQSCLIEFVQKMPSSFVVINNIDIHYVISSISLQNMVDTSRSWNGVHRPIWWWTNQVFRGQENDFVRTKLWWI